MANGANMDTAAKLVNKELKDLITAGVLGSAVAILFDDSAKLIFFGRHALRKIRNAMEAGGFPIGYITTKESGEDIIECDYWLISGLKDEDTELIGRILKSLRKLFIDQMAEAAGKLTEFDNFDDVDVPIN